MAAHTSSGDLGLGYSARDIRRWAPEAAKTSWRTAFERDRARVVHSAGFRRLGAKTQVLSPSGSDFIRNRLTHSLEVAQVGRELAKALGCDPDVVDAACLAHDLGHPPFGHNGESALAGAAADIGGFEGNAQTLRLLTRLEAKTIAGGRSVGLNLTRACLDAATKYPWRRGEQPAGIKPTKFGVYDDDAEIFDWMRAGAPPGRRCIEAQIMDLADDIAYSVHDVEDGVVGGHLDLSVLDRAGERQRVVDQTRSWYLPGASTDRLGQAVEDLRALPEWVGRTDGTRASLAALKDMTSQLIGKFCESCVLATRVDHGTGTLTRYGADLVVPPDVEAQVAVLKGMAALYVMVPREDEVLYKRQQTVVTDLVEVLSERGPLALEPAFAQDWEQAADDAARLRVVVDQVASLTDVSAVGWHVKFCGGFDRG